MANPQDSTRRNTQAANKKIAELNVAVKKSEVSIRTLGKSLKKLEKRLKAVEQACREFGIDWASPDNDEGQV